MSVEAEQLECFHCGGTTELRCSDCAIENELTHKGLPVCAQKECRDKHGQWHQRPPLISELEDALDRGAEITILPNGRVVAAERDSEHKPLTFKQDLGGEYAVQ